MWSKTYASKPGRTSSNTHTKRAFKQFFCLVLPSTTVLYSSDQLFPVSHTSETQSLYEAQAVHLYSKFWSGLNRHYISRATNSPELQQDNYNLRQCLLFTKIKHITHHLIECICTQEILVVYLLVAKIDTRYYRLNNSDETQKSQIY